MPVHHRTDESLAVQQVLERLSPPDREVLYLFDVAGFKTDEIGAMLGVRGTAIRQRLSRARERFRLLYGAEA
jgi:RNA polymerase sigma-70 factor (ECF subfamily)